MSAPGRPAPGMALLRYNLARIGWTLSRLAVLAVLVFDLLVATVLTVAQPPQWGPAALTAGINAALMIVVLTAMRPERET